MNFQEAYNIIDSIPGWMGKPDCAVLWEYASKVEGTIVEIGAYMGRSAILMALASPNSNIITIDDFVRGNHGDLMRNIEGYNISVIDGKSQKIGKSWKEPIDLLHVDGDHFLDGLKKDIELFYPYVKSGEHMLCHDYRIKKFDVRKVVEKMFDEFSVKSGFAICTR